jgi:hypothetical protein
VGTEGQIVAKKPKLTDAEHLDWLVRCRSQNQQTSLKLYKLMTTHTKILKKSFEFSSVGISLVAISFNLWRAVFLAEAADDGDDDVDHSIRFLKTLISDNAIAYAQDRNARAWTFISYLNNARFRLVNLSNLSPEILPNFTSITDEKDLITIVAWEHYQANTDVAVANFANALKRSLN